MDEVLFLVVLERDVEKVDRLQFVDFERTHAHVLLAHLVQLLLLLADPLGLSIGTFFATA